ncbi:MAG: choice-of-anchor D domain-containing protein, partial [Myxococcota bacterium]|nr:choice-of-anchor D domain-containing protein [Myxococcota bacterium]
EYDFGTVDVGDTDSMSVTISNEGTAFLTISDLDYDSATAELALDPDEATNGPLPWILGSGESRYVYVDYAPEGDSAIAGTLSVASDDPDTPEAQAIQVGQGKSFEGFSTG